MIVEELTQNMKAGKQTNVILLDYSKASRTKSTIKNLFLSSMAMASEAKPSKYFYGLRLS